ncbi:MAG: hypothetical protein KGJ02_04805 [Verrucomicrobiota bacterium]|nr:hypothetical protein [Verrucomicrobiota bacterium]
MYVLLAALTQMIYTFTPEPIDVVIPYHPKDAETLELCIRGIRENGENVRRIIVISKEPATSSAEWFDEANYPFSPEDLALEIFHGDAEAAHTFLTAPNTRIGWIYQQFLKLYAPLVIPDISSNVLILDSDVIFLKPLAFMDAKRQPYFTVGTNYTKEYFEHAAKLLPGLRRANLNYSGIVHHMLFQRPIIDDLFHLISLQHHTEPWKAICRCIDQAEVYKSCLSEYEIYFNFVSLRTSQKTIRHIRWTEVVPDLYNINAYRRQNYIFIASQEWYRRYCKDHQ